jgi:transcriptional regulator with XRE-family HTH domain
MRKQYDQLLALALMQRMRDGEEISKLSEETGISIPTLWRWREGKSFPSSGISKNYHEYYEENRRKIIERIKQNKYGGLYFQVLQRDNYECQNCYSKSYLRIHHLNGNKKDNRMENLLTLCQRCHRIVHLAACVIGRLPPYGRVYEMALKLLEKKRC